MLKGYLPIRLCVLFLKLTVISGISFSAWKTATADSTGNPGHCAPMAEGTSWAASTICRDWGIKEYTEPVFTINGQVVTAPSLPNRRHGTEEGDGSASLDPSYTVAAKKNGSGAYAANAAVQAS